MIQYIIAFSLYTLAMIGIFFIAFVVYKKTMSFNSIKSNTGMKIEDMLRLSQRKSLYVINVEGERFLIASDFDNTTFLAKLSQKQISKKPVVEPLHSMQTHFEPHINNEEKNIVNSLFTNANKKIQKKNEESTRKQIEEYIKELEALDFKESNIQNKDEHDYSNAIDAHSRSAIMKSILKELDNNSKRTSV